MDCCKGVKHIVLTQPTLLTMMVPGVCLHGRTMAFDAVDIRRNDLISILVSYLSQVSPVGRYFLTGTSNLRAAGETF